MFNDIFPGTRWDKFIKQICSKLQFESVLITGLPQVGLTSFLRNIEQRYDEIIKNDKTNIIYFEIFSNRIQPSHLDKKIAELVRYKLKFPRYLDNLNTEEIMYEITQRGERLLIITNRFQYLRSHHSSLEYLKMLRAIDPFKIRFLLGSDISFLTNVDSFAPAGVLASANAFVLPTLTHEETSETFKRYKKLYNWKVPISFSKEIYELSGGVCGLVKYISKYVHDNNCKKISENELLGNQAIFFKLKDIYDTLEDNFLIDNYSLHEAHNDILQEIGVIDSKHSLRIGLLKNLLTSPGKKQDKSIYRILSVQELKIFEFLNERPDHIFSLDELSEYMWGEHVTKKYSLWALYKVISNLNKKIKKYGYRIENFKGRGYSLTKRALT